MKKFGKAVVVIIIVGIGLVHNFNKKTVFWGSNNYFPIYNNQDIKADTAKYNDSKLFIYTKKMIDSGISYLISNL